MKRLLLVLVLLMTAGSLFAAELKINGDMYVRGTTLSNMDLVDTDEASFSYFDYDLNINAALVANENATVYTRLTYDRNVDGSGKVADSDSESTLAVERAYINYKFHPALQLNTGLMGGGQWGTAFGDTEINVMRVQAIGALSKDMVFIATYQKDDEQGFYSVKDAEKDDQNTYYLASRMQFGNITVMPLLTYVMKGVNNNGTTIYDSYYAGFEENFTEGVGGTLDLYFQSQGVPAGAITTYDAAAAASTGDNDSYTLTTMAFTLALMGDFGMFGFEAEGVYIKGDLDGFDDDHAALALALQESTGFSEAAYGLYVNLFAKVDALKAGFIYAYGSADEEDGAYNWGDDFDLFVVMDDYIAYDFADRAGLTGFSAYKLYADYTMDKITVMVGAGYGASNWKDDDATFMEGDLGASYAFDENTAYTVMFGYAKTSDFYTADVDADAYRVYHKMAVKF